jgi:hypothetical protein
VVATHFGFLVPLVLIESETNGPNVIALLELVSEVLFLGVTRLHRLLPQHRIICTLDKPLSEKENKT